MKRLFNLFKKLRSKQPGVVVFITIEDDQNVRLEMDWNDTFIKKLHELGFYGHSEEESVQKFMTGITMPHMNDDSAPVTSSEHPGLTEEATAAGTTIRR
jgi:hypothetical protein